MRKYFFYYLLDFFYFLIKMPFQTHLINYTKIDLFGEVLEKIKNEYVDDIDQADVMDSAINGVLQSLDPYSAYMSPIFLKV